MKTLTFTSANLDLIACGRKTQTLRQMKRPLTNAISGTTFTATDYRRSIRLILDCWYMRHLSQLTEYEAHRDGFESLPHLLDALRQYEIQEELLTVIRFSLVQTQSDTFLPSLESQLCL